MKKFILGLVVGAAASYVATKLADEKTREELFEEMDKASDKAKETLKYGRGRAMRMGVHARQEYRKGRKKLSKVTGDFADKLSDELSEHDKRNASDTNEAQA